MIAYIETKITRIFDEMPQGGRFNETTTTYETVDCCDSFDADAEVLRRKRKLIDKYSDKSVWFDVKRISLEDYELASVKDEAFERRFAI